MTLRDKLREVADQYKGLAALAGAFLTGGLLTASALGVIQLPQRNAEAIQDLEVALAEGDAGLQVQIDATVEQLTIQTTFLCILATRLDSDLIGECPGLRRMTVPPNGR